MKRSGIEVILAFADNVGAPESQHPISSTFPQNNIDNLYDNDIMRGKSVQ